MITIDETLDMSTVTVADIALKFPQAVEILNRHNLDFCCNGKKPFVAVCQKANLDAPKIWQEILDQNAMFGPDNRMRFDTWEPDLLIDFIVQHHHQFVRHAVPSITELLDKVCSVHGGDQPEVIEIREEFNALAEELLDHMVREEEVLFPAIKRLSGPSGPLSNSPALLNNLQSPILVMEHEHTVAGDLVKSIRARTQNYTPPAHACPTFRLTYKLLQEFETDLMQHIHLENNILFPKVKI